MKSEPIKNNHKIIALMLLGLSIFLLICIVFKVTNFFVASAKAETLVKNAVNHSLSDPNEVKKHLSASKTIADELKKKNLFAPPPPKKHPVTQVIGIMGKEALINGQWKKVGDKIGDAKIIAIKPTEVVIEWEGKEKVFAPIAAASSFGPEKKPKRPVVKKKSVDKKVQKSVQQKVAAPVEEVDPLAWMGLKLSAKLRAKILEKWNTLSDEEKEKFKEQWNSMSDEQKQQALQAMEQHL